MGTLVPARDHAASTKSKDYRYSTDHQVVGDAGTQLVVTVGRPLSGNRDDCKAYAESGTEYAARNAAVTADGGHRGTSATVPHRRRTKDEPLAEWGEGRNASQRSVRARVEHTSAHEALERAARLPPPRPGRGPSHGGRPPPRPRPGLPSRRNDSLRPQTHAPQITLWGSSQAPDPNQTVLVFFGPAVPGREADRPMS